MVKYIKTKDEIVKIGDLLQDIEGGAKFLFGIHIH